METYSFYLGDKFWTKHLVADVRLMNSDCGVVLVFYQRINRKEISNDSGLCHVVNLEFTRWV